MENPLDLEARTVVALWCSWGRIAPSPSQWSTGQDDTILFLFLFVSFLLRSIKDANGQGPGLV